MLRLSIKCIKCTRLLDNMCALVFAIYIKKYLKAKEEELWKLKYFTMQKYTLQKILSKKNQNPSRSYNNSVN